MPTYREWLRVAVLGVAPMLAACSGVDRASRGVDDGDGSARVPGDATPDGSGHVVAEAEADVDVEAGDPDGWPVASDAGVGDAHWPEAGRGPILCPDAGLSVGPFSATRYDAGRVNAIAVDDFNGDGVPDVVAGLYVAHVEGDYGEKTPPLVALGRPNGTLGAFESTGVRLENVEGILVGDFDGDGRADLRAAMDWNCVSKLGCNFASETLFGAGDGGLEGQILGDFLLRRQVADFNGDGRDDVVGFKPHAYERWENYPYVLTVQLGRSDRTLTSESLGSYPNPTGLVAGDVDGDGKPDVILAAPTAMTSGPLQLFVLLGRGDGTFQAPVVYPVDASPVALADFNGDGLPDLAVVDSSGSLRIMLGTRDGVFRPPGPASEASGSFGYYAVVADLNGDGFPDVLMAPTNASHDPYALAALVGRGDGTFVPSTFYGPAKGLVGPWSSADFNGDGLPDLAVNVDDGPEILLNGTCPR